MNWLQRNGFLFLLVISVPVLQVGCKITYGFNPASNTDYIGKPFTVEQFQNVSSLAPPTLSQSFTEKVRDVFQRQSRMRLVDKKGELKLEGSITGYSIKPVAITSTEQAANNRLTITVKVKCTNKIAANADFEQTFSRFADFDSSQELSNVEETLIEEINDQLAQDIFNRSLGNW